MESSKPTISVIVPVYNTELYLHRCIDSILSQTFTDFELLLINDGSTDRSGEICDEYAGKDKRVRVFHKGNGGVSSARNMGLDEARGEWVAFVDADDYIFKKSLELLLKESNADLIVGGFSRIHLSSGNVCSFVPNHRIIRIGTDIVFIENLVETYLSTPWCKLFKKEIIRNRKIRFCQDLFYGEDTDFVFRYVIEIGTIQFISEQVYCYCYDGARFGKYVFKVKDLEKLIECMNQNFDLLSQKTRVSFSELKNAFLHDYCSLYLDGLLKIQNYKVFLKETKDYKYENCLFCVDALKNRVIIWLLKYCPRLFYIFLHKRLL